VPKWSGIRSIVEKLEAATEEIEQAVEHVDTIVASAEDWLGTSGPTVQFPLGELSEATGQVGQAVAQVETIIAATAGSQGPVRSGQREPSADNLDQATQRFTEAVQDVETLVVAAQEESREAHTLRAGRLRAEQ